MRIKIENDYLNRSVIKDIFIYTLKYNIKNNLNKLTDILKYYSLDDLLDATSKFQYDGVYLYIQDNTKEEYLLRYLEYGGQRVKPSFIISGTLKELNLI